MSTLPILTDDEYKDAAVARCPVCRNEDLEYGDVSTPANRSEAV